MIFGYDLDFSSGTISKPEDLRTAVTYSLLSRARAQPDDPTRNADDLYGWWGDTYPDVPGDVFGSRLWLLQGRHMNEALGDGTTPGLAEIYTREALQWMIEDALAERIDLEISAFGPTAVGIRVGIVRPGQLLTSWIDTWEASL